MKLTTTLLLVASAATSVLGSALGSSALVARDPSKASDAIAALVAEVAQDQIKPGSVSYLPTHQP